MNLRLEESNGLARCIFDQPNSKVNVLSTAVWTELAAIIASLRDRPGMRGLLLESAKPGIFIAGADLKELDAADPDRPEAVGGLIELGLNVLYDLESLPFPTAALIDGAALGGGLEVALACDFRFVSENPKVRLGLPEIKLGLIPGWGGTQRLTRFIGVEESLTRLLSGEPYFGEDAPPEELVDMVCHVEDMTATAIRFLEDDWPSVRTMKRSSVITELMPTEAFLRDLPELLAELDPRQQPAGMELAKVVLQGATVSLAEGIEQETQGFLRLAGSAPSRELIREFFDRRKS